MTQGSTSRRRTCIDILNDDSLLYIFYHCRPALLDESDHENLNIVLAGGRWERERWWYKFTQVCRRWRHLILASPSYLGISLVCRPGTPVADMLAHSPPLPIIIDHLYVAANITAAAEDKVGVLLALEHRNRVRRIRLRAFVPSLARLVAAIEGRFPMLEYLYIEPISAPDSNWSLPSTFRAPRLRHLILFYIGFPTGSTLPAELVTLALQLIDPSTNFSTNELLQKLSLMPQLETLGLSLYPPFFDQDVEGHLSQIPSSAHVTLPNLRWFMFAGPPAYIKSVRHRITMPSLEVAEFIIPNTPDLDYSTYFVLQFVYKTENPRFRGIWCTFLNRCVVLTMFPNEGTGMPTLHMQDRCGNPVGGLLSAVQRFRAMGPALSEVELLTLENETSSEWDHWPTGSGLRSVWHELLGLFNKVKTLHVAGGELIEGLSRSLLPEGLENPIEVLPDLRVLSYPKGSRVGKSCRLFIAVRRKAGYPVTLACR